MGGALPRSLGFVLVLAIAVLGAPAGAAADPIRVTGGSLSFDTGGPPSFSLSTSSGQRLEAEGFRIQWPACFYRCAPGVAIPMSIVATNTADTTFFRANGVTMHPVMRFVVSATSVTLGSGTEEFRRPFTFTGRLTAYASPDMTGTPAFDVTLIGSGMARLVMGLEDDGTYSFLSLDYDFGADPIPEPATLLLVGAGAALMWRRRRSTTECEPRT
jgi:hypothetical protein